MLELDDGNVLTHSLTTIQCSTRPTLCGIASGLSCEVACLAIPAFNDALPANQTNAEQKATPDTHQLVALNYL